MNTLSDAISQSTTCQDMCLIFEKSVTVQIDRLWGIDNVGIEGYPGTVSTDFIAQEIFLKFSCQIEDPLAALKLADLLINRVFLPLARLDASYSFTSILYKIRNWVPAGDTYMLKNSQCIRYLQKARYSLCLIPSPSQHKSPPHTMGPIRNK